MLINAWWAMRSDDLSLTTVDTWSNLVASPVYRQSSPIYLDITRRNWIINYAPFMPIRHSVALDRHFYSPLDINTVRGKNYGIRLSF